MKKFSGVLLALCMVTIFFGCKQATDAVNGIQIEFGTYVHSSNSLNTIEIRDGTFTSSLFGSGTWARKSTNKNEIVLSIYSDDNIMSDTYEAEILSPTQFSVHADFGMLWVYNKQN